MREGLPQLYLLLVRPYASKPRYDEYDSLRYLIDNFPHINVSIFAYHHRILTT
jgi:hypothetical protein